MRLTEEQRKILDKTHCELFLEQVKLGEMAIYCQKLQAKLMRLEDVINNLLNGDI